MEIMVGFVIGQLIFLVLFVLGILIYSKIDVYFSNKKYHKEEKEYFETHGHLRGIPPDKKWREEYKLKYGKEYDDVNFIS